MKPTAPALIALLTLAACGRTDVVVLNTTTTSVSGTDSGAGSTDSMTSTSGGASTGGSTTTGATTASTDGGSSGGPTGSTSGGPCIVAEEYLEACLVAAAITRNICKVKCAPPPPLSDCAEAGCVAVCDQAYFGDREVCFAAYQTCEGPDETCELGCHATAEACFGAVAVTCTDEEADDCAQGLRACLGRCTGFLGLI